MKEVKNIAVCREKKKQQQMDSVVEMCSLEKSALKEKKKKGSEIKIPDTFLT